MQRSEQINELMTALAKAQAMMKPAPKDSVNPHFKNRYSDLASVTEALREPLSSNGLALLQTPAAEGSKVTVTTLLGHSSGQWIAGDLTLVAQQATPQGIGSAITYGRRYGAMAITGLSSDDDDDGNQASAPPRKPYQKSQPRRDDGHRYEPTGEAVPFEGPSATIGEPYLERYSAQDNKHRALVRELAKPYGVTNNADLHALSNALAGPPAVEMDHIAAAVKEWVDDRGKV